MFQFEYKLSKFYTVNKEESCFGVLTTFRGSKQVVLVKMITYTSHVYVKTMIPQ